MHCILFIHLSNDAHWSCSHLLAAVNHVTVNVGVQISESLFSTLVGICQEVELLDSMVKSFLQFRNISDSSEMVISAQTKGHLQTGGGVEMQAEISDLCFHDLSHVWWREVFCFQVWFYFFSYSIKLLAVQELLDREALEKVNILFLLPQIHKLRAECHTQEKLHFLLPETALAAKLVCCFVFITVGEPCRFLIRMPPYCS